jgi:hypothetical protein
MQVYVAELTEYRIGAYKVKYLKYTIAGRTNFIIW